MYKLYKLKIMKYNNKLKGGASNFIYRGQSDSSFVKGLGIFSILFIIGIIVTVILLKHSSHNPYF